MPTRQPPPIKIPKFKGEHYPNVYLKWEQNIDQIFNIRDISDQKQVDLVVLESEEYAMTCMASNQGPPTASWVNIKILMCARFVPSYFRR